MKGFALGLTLKQRQKATRKSPINTQHHDFQNYWYCFKVPFSKYLKSAKIQSLKYIIVVVVVVVVVNIVLSSSSSSSSSS